MTKDKFHFFSIIAEARYTVETFSFVITVPVLIMTRPPGEVTHHVWGEMWVWRTGWRILMLWPFLREAPLPSLLLGNTRRWQCCRAPLLDEMPFGEQKICFHRQGLWACESFSCRGVWYAWSACTQHHHRPLQPASSVRGCCHTAPLDAPRSFLCLLLTAPRVPAGRATSCPVARRLQPAWAGLRLLQLQRNSQSCHLIQCLLN